VDNRHIVEADSLVVVGSPEAGIAADRIQTCCIDMCFWRAVSFKSFKSWAKQ